MQLVEFVKLKEPKEQATGATLQRKASHFKSNRLLAQEEPAGHEEHIVELARANVPAAQFSGNAAVEEQLLPAGQDKQEVCKLENG